MRGTIGATRRDVCGIQLTRLVEAPASCYARGMSDDKKGIKGVTSFDKDGPVMSIEIDGMGIEQYLKRIDDAAMDPIDRTVSDVMELYGQFIASGASPEDARYWAGMLVMRHLKPE